MASRIEEHIEVLRRTAGADALDMFAAADAMQAIGGICGFGQDMIEGVPAIVSNQISSFAYAGDYLKGRDKCKVREQIANVGPEAQAVELACIATRLAACKTASTRNDAIDAIEQGIKDGVDSEAIIPGLRLSLDTLRQGGAVQLSFTGASASPDEAERAKERAVKRAGEDLERGVRRIEEMLKSLQDDRDTGATAVNGGEDAQAPSEFAIRACTKRSAMALKSDRLSHVFDGLVKRIRELRPDTSEAGAAKSAATALALECPSCGRLTPEAVMLMLIGLKGMFSEILQAGGAVAFTGPNAAKLSRGLCPDCAGTYFIAVFEPQKAGFKAEKTSRIGCLPSAGLLAIAASLLWHLFCTRVVLP